MSEADLYSRYDSYRHVLFCTDFSENANFAFEFAVAAAARRPDTRLTILHVIPEPEAQFWKTYIYEVEDIDDKAQHDIDEKVAAEYLPRVPEGLDVEVVVRIGRDTTEILDFAEESGVDLIVMGRQGQSEMKTVFFGNVTEKVVRKAGCPVLVIPMIFEEPLRTRGGGGEGPGTSSPEG